MEYKLVDADAIENIFPEKAFDFIFSSNVLEHLRDPKRFLAATLPMLMDGGVAVHIIPSRHIKIFYLLFHYPNLFLLALDRIIGKFRGKPLFQGSGIDLENNINVENKTKKAESKFKKLLIPKPHGNFPNHWSEFMAFGKTEWEKKFIEAGYSIVSYEKGPAFSGYGFGLSKILRELLESLGIFSEHIFILRKMTPFEAKSWEYTRSFLPRGSFYEQKKFVKDWRKKEKSAKAFLADFKRDVADPNGKNILDVGFGNGIIMKEFLSAGAVAYGVETEEKLSKISGLKNTFIYDGKSFPFPDNTFDYAYSTSVLEHMSYPQEVLSEIYRTLVPGGKFYLSFPNKYAPKESHTGLWFISWLPRSLTQYLLKLFKSSQLEDWNLHFISFFKMKKMAKKAGFNLLYDTKSHSGLRKLIKKSLAKIGIHYGILLKTIIITLEKPKA